MAAYAQVSDMIARYPMRDLIQLTNQDTSIRTVNEARIQVFLDDASDEIDAYLEARFALPLSNPPDILTRICCQLAMYHMQALRPIHDLEYAKFQYEKNLSFLDEVSDGQRTLGLNGQSETEPADPSSPAVSTVEAGGGFELRVFSRGSMRGF